MIRIVSIKNFRSIHQVNFSTEYLTTFVGKNDAGKSNLLRALNLFFNNTTDHRTSFSFDRDFNRDAVVREKKAREIEIELSIQLPSSFHRKDKPNTVQWKKVWRAGGLHAKLEKKRWSDHTEFGSYSKIPTFLDRIAFYYIPAIKDPHFFSDLQGQMYDMLAENAESKLRLSAKDFEISIRENISELMSLVTNHFGPNNEIRLPENLRGVFETLEFNADDIPLTRRGDGIKVRHIPMILKFIGDKRNALLTGGAIKYTNIWGFEEPENNLEMSSAFEMAKSFESTAINGGQIFVTTHSPAFYSIGQEAVADTEISSVLYGVKKKRNETCVKVETRDILHIEMGVMPLIAGYVKSEHDRWCGIVNKQEQAIQKLKNEANYGEPRIIVEGPSDKVIVELVLKLFYEQVADDIKVGYHFFDGYGSADSVASQVVAWHCIQQHRSKVNRAIGLFDDDESGKKAYDHVLDILKKLSTKRLITKPIRLSASKNIGQLRKSGYLVPVDLESFYSDATWLHAKKEQWLEPVTKKEYVARLKPEIIYRAFQPDFNINSELSDVDILRLKYRWKKDKKNVGARYVKRMSKSKALDELWSLAEKLKKGVEFVIASEES